MSIKFVKEMPRESREIERDDLLDFICFNAICTKKGRLTRMGFRIRLEEDKCC